MFNKQDLESFMKDHYKYCSFTDWSNNKTSVTYSSIDKNKKFSSRYIFVALNPTSDNPAFHSGSPQDDNLKYIFKDSKKVYYITDLIKLNPNTLKKNATITDITDSRNVVKWVKEKDKKWLNKHVKTLKKEISLIGGNPTIVAFGDAVYRLLLENRCGLCNREKPIKIEKVPHFSRNSREKVKEQVEALKYFK